MKPYLFLSAALWIVGSVAWAVPVRVQVLGPDGKPVPGAQVRVRAWKGDVFGTAESRPEDVLKAQTDAQGNASFDLPEVEQGASTRAWRAASLGLATAWAPGLAVNSNALQPGANSIALEAGGVARGVVVDAQAKPVEGALVSLFGVVSEKLSARFGGLGALGSGDGGLQEEAFHTRTGADGRWTLGHAPLGGVALVHLGGDKFARSSTSSPVFAQNDDWFWDTLSTSTLRAAVSLGATDGDARSFNGHSGRSENGVLVARPAATISGRLLDPAGAPIAGAMVFAAPITRGYGARASSSAKTDAAGAWKLERLNAGEFTVSATLPDAPRATVPALSPRLKVSIKEDETAPPLELKMNGGDKVGEIAIRVVDAATGKGIAGARAYVDSEKRGDFVFSPTPPTDAEGSTSAFVMPGRHRMILFDVPEGYVHPGTTEEESKVEVAGGATKPFEWKLKRGLAGGGRIVDEAGNLVPGVGVWFREDKKGWNSSQNSTFSDARGRWKSSSFEPGTWKVNVSNLSGDEYKIVRPKTIEFPRTGDFDIVVAPIARRLVTGRIVDDKGAPVAGARVAAKITSQQDGMGNQSERTAFSGRDGQWRIANVPESASTITLEVVRAGFATTKAPTATKEKNQPEWAVSEAVLKPRDARLAGRILNAAKEPVGGAQVLASPADASARADSEGRFSFDEMPEGEVELVAVAPGGAAAASVRAPGADVSLSLKAPSVAKPKDVEGARAVLEEAWGTSRGSQYYRRDSLAGTLALHDPDEALLLARGADKEAPDGVVLEIVRLLARRDPESAAAWAEGQVPGIQDSNQRLQVLLVLADSLAEKNPDEAKPWLRQAKAVHEGVKEAWQKRNATPKIALLSARLQEADADKWFAAAMKEAGERTEGMHSYGILAWEFATLRPAWAAEAIEAAVKVEPQQPDYASPAGAVAAQAIRRLARTDAAGAKALLAKYATLKSDRHGADWEMSQARAAVLGARARAGEDVDALIKEADAMNWQPRVRALTQVADNGPTARRVEILKVALQVSEENGRHTINETLQILRRLLPLDREAARAGLEKLRADLEAPRDPSDEHRRLRASDVAAWAWMYRTFDAASARWMLEREWARGLALPTTDEDEWNRWGQMTSLVYAMAPLDIERALSWAGRLPIAGHNASGFVTQRALARWMLASEEERTASTLESWGRDDEEDERYSNDW
jgi:hypothetical protein